MFPLALIRPKRKNHNQVKDTPAGRAFFDDFFYGLHQAGKEG